MNYTLFGEETSDVGRIFLGRLGLYPRSFQVETNQILIYILD